MEHGIERVYVRVVVDYSYSKTNRVRHDPHAASGETTFSLFVGSTTPLARALEAGPPARMVTAAGRADRYPSRTRRLRTEQVARRPQLPRSFVAQHAEKPLCRCGACPDVYSCSLKTVDQSILKDVRCILNTFAHTDPIRNANTDARHTPRNGTCRRTAHIHAQFYRVGHNGGATAPPPHEQARLSAHERIAPARAAWRPPQRRPMRESIASCSALPPPGRSSDAAAATRCRRC